MGIAIAAFAFAAAGASTAMARTAQVTQVTMSDERMPSGMVRAPSNAFEIQVNTGYAQGFGPRIPATNKAAASTIDRPGMSAGLGLAYRATPNSSVGVVGAYSMQDGVNGGTLRGATAGLDATYHANPYQRLDPFLSLGTGYRMLWESPAGTAPDSLSHGFQLARAAVGVDVRLNKDIAIAPTLGGDVNMFLWRNTTGSKTQMIDNPKVNAFVFAGVSGRFDMGGTRQRPSTYVGSR